MEAPPGRSLPDDVLADALARLAPRSLAVSRCVCRDWRAVVDTRCPPLRADLLPISLGGTFVVTNQPEAVPEFFARPSMAKHKIACEFKSFGNTEKHHSETLDIEDWCNGLLLLDQLVVVNPATRQWARLPPCPSMTSPEGYDFNEVFLVFDPMLSPHCEVLLMKNPLDYEDKISKGSGWPPSVYMMHVYSSETRRWEERPFVREGGPLENIANVQAYVGHSAYWHEALYVHCTTDFIMRINLSNDKYQVIRFPAGIKRTVSRERYLGKSKNGVHFALFDDQHQLQVWFLDELGGKIEWILKRVIHPQAMIAHFIKNRAQTDRPVWIVSQDHNYDQEDNGGPIVEKILDWDSDDDNAVEIQDPDAKCFYGGNHIFGFHPYREIVFLNLSTSGVAAYHFNSSKIQELGKLGRKSNNKMRDAFMYTPCWTGVLSGKLLIYKFVYNITACV